MPFPAAQVSPDDRLTADNRVDERAVDAVGLGTDVGADEHLRGDIQRQLLGRFVEMEAGSETPAGNDACNRGVRLLDIADESLALERLLHDAPVMAMLLEVHEHHA